MQMCLRQQEALLQQQTENKAEILKQQGDIMRQQAKDKEEILRQQAKDKEDMLRQHAAEAQDNLKRQAPDKQDILRRFDSVAPRLDNLEKQAAQDREAIQVQHAATQKLLQKQGQQCAALQATLQQSLTAQNAHILQVQGDCANITQQVQMLSKQHEQTRTEATAGKARMTTLETTVKEMRHEHDKLKDNERAEKETAHAQIAMVNKQIVALTDKVAQLCETQVAQGRTANAIQTQLRTETDKLRNAAKNMKDNDRKVRERTRVELAECNHNVEALKEEVAQLREETEKMRNNKPSQLATFQKDIEHRLAELRAGLENLHTAQERVRKEEGRVYRV